MRSSMLLMRQNPREVVQSQALLLTISSRSTKTASSSRLKKGVEFHNLVAKTLYATK
jgi:hypothetical protein